MKITRQEKPNTKASTLILPLFEGKADSDLISTFADTFEAVDFKGKFKEIVVLYPQKGKKIFLLGLGKEEDLPKASQAFRSLAFHHHAKWDREVSLAMNHLPAEIAYHASLGIYLASYDPGIFKTEKDEGDAFQINDLAFEITHGDDSVQKLAEEGSITADTQMRYMQLVDNPGNKKTPEDLGAFAIQAALDHDFQAEVLDKRGLKREGLGAVIAVGQGSKNDPVLIKMEYKPAEMVSEKPQLGLVGKGITFDTGGLSIKGATNMHYMKSDMGGAAAVMGAIELAARLKLNIHVVGLIPSAENTVDARSVKPGDVIDSYSGKTIEVIDTDAEGRLVLADGLAYINKNYQPETLLDLATLTGSSVRTLGYAAGALFSQSDELVSDLVEAGQATHERLWQLPLWDDYKPDIHSDVADVRNFSGKPIAGAITAAKFLEYFTGDHPRWAHMDIAGVAFGDSEFTKMKSATGYGIRLLVAYMRKFIEE